MKTLLLSSMYISVIFFRFSSSSLQIHKLICVVSVHTSNLAIKTHQSVKGAPAHVELITEGICFH